MNGNSVRMRNLGIVLGTVTASVMVGRMAVSPSYLRLAVVLVAGVAVAGFGFRAPRALLYSLAVWLAALGLLRRVVTLRAGSVATDPLLLVAPLALTTLVLVAAQKGAFERLTTLAKSVLILNLIAFLEVFNPDQGGLRVGLGGALLVLMPMLAFWIGRAFVDDRLLRGLLMLIGALAIPAALYGLWQTFEGFPSWDARWIASSNFIALNVYGTTRPFSFFSSPAEYGFYLAIGIAVWLSFGRSATRLPITIAATALLGIALVYETARLVALLLIAALGIGFAASRGVRPIIALACGAAALAVVSLLASHFAGSGTPGQASSLVSHEVQGLASPFGSSSTGSGHLALLVSGVRYAFSHPAGVGVGAVTQAAAKFGGVNTGTEADVSNAAVGLGLLGLLAYLAVAISGLFAAYQIAVGRRDPLSLAALIIVIATGLEWLNGGQYAIAFMPWLMLGWVDAQRVRSARPLTSAPE